MFKFLTFLLFVVTVVHGFEHVLDLKIISGNTNIQEDIKKVPYMAQILYKGTYSCGGCIRGKSWILTAAHCFDYHKKNIADFEILTGTSYREGSDGQRHKVKRVILHYNYMPKDVNAENDIALVELETPMIFNDVQRSIVVHPKFPNVPEYVKVSGYGMQDESLESSPIIKSILVPLVDQSICQDYYGRGINGNMFCAGTDDEHHCEGDSGSPAVDLEGRLVGIVSRGKNCHWGSAPSIYIKVVHYISWLDEKTKIPSLYY